MPFIDSKITVKVSDEKKEVLKAKIGKAVSIIGKPESFLMVGFILLEISLRRVFMFQLMYSVL